MAGRGPAPKPAHLRQRTNKKSSATTLTTPVDVTVPEIPNPDNRTWHPLTLEWWKDAWASPMASQWLDRYGIGRVAVAVDNFYKTPRTDLLAEIRLQGACYGLTPLDRSRLQWEIAKGEEAERKRTLPQSDSRKISDPRKVLRAVK